MGRLDSIRSNCSISSSSTYIYGMGGRKQFHKSQLSLYDKISRKISLGRPASRKSSYGHSQVRSCFSLVKTLKFNMTNPQANGHGRQRSVSETGKPKLEELAGGVENRSFEKEEIYGVSSEQGDEDMWANQPDLDLILDKKLLETITENQNSPYSTQASHCKSRRESAQSIFASMDGAARRGSLPTRELSREPTVLELFHENELEEEEGVEGRVSRSRSHSLASQSLSGSHRSRESGVGSLGGDSSFMEPLAEEKPRLMVELPVRDKINMEPLVELPSSRDKQMLEPLVEETPRLIQISCQHHGPEMANRSSEEIVREEDERNGEEEHSPSPFLPKRF